MQIKEQFRKVVVFFKMDKIIYSKGLHPGVMQSSYRTSTGQKFVRIGFTNRTKTQGLMPITDILFSDITGIRKIPSPFKKWLYGLIGKKPRATFYTFTKTNSSK